MPNDVKVEDFIHRLAVLEITVQKDSAMMHNTMNQLQADMRNFNGDVLTIRSQLQTQDALLKLYQQLDEKIEDDRRQRNNEHKELMQLINKKMDSDRPVKWANNFQKTVQWIIWALTAAGIFGLGNWVQATLIPH